MIGKFNWILFTMIERTKHGGHITDVDGNIKHSPIISWSKQSANFQSFTELDRGGIQNNSNWIGNSFI